MILLDVAIFIILLAASAFFSGSEAAFFSLKVPALHKSDENERILKLLERPRRLLITLLTGNTIINTTMAFLAALITADIAHRSGANLAVLVGVETVVVTLVILLVSEITPKILALRHSEEYARRASMSIKIFSFVLYPVAALLYNITHFFTRWIPWKKEGLFDSPAELQALADLGADRGMLKDQERQMIKSVFDYGETAVREIMVPRIDVVGMDITTPVDRAVEIVRTSPFSKFPVYEGDIDSIEGILYAKDLLPYLNGSDGKSEILSLCRKPLFVPESKQIDDLLRDFQKGKETIAIVVDEFGGTSGLVTLEDIVEEVVGEIRDEFDREAPLVVPTGKHRWLVNAKISINDLQASIPIHFPEEREYDTLGGFLLEHFGDIPAAGNNVDISDYRFEVENVSENRIINVVITKTLKAS
ncbi:MAG: hemolysin family protein [Fidelibacterota bacterium]